MRDLNVDFLELYIKVDQFIRDANGSEKGVSLSLNKWRKNALMVHCMLKRRMMT